MMNETIRNWYDANEQAVKDWSLDIWSHPELSLAEFRACAVTAKFMEDNGFTVETFHCSDSTLPPNTVVATWGSGKPVVGFIGEYDALPGLGQEAAPRRAPKEGPGHGCGHSLMCPSTGSAAVALKAAMEAEGLSGTIKFFACPAEETVEGKMHLARDGVFDGLDCCMAWHPAARDLIVCEFDQNSMTDITVEFFGKAAHAATAPEKGRSALDACELMNMGVNYLREHVHETTRMHYCYLNGGEKPNVVPEYAALRYYLRSKTFADNVELLSRVEDCAKGASIMTGTTYKITVNTMVTGCALIDGFNAFLYEAAKKIPPLTYTDEEKAFAAELFENINGRAPAEGEPVVFTGCKAPAGVHVHMASSTDAGYLTRLAPTARLNGLGFLPGTPGHSWGVVASVGSPIGLKAAVYTGKVLAQCGYDIMKDPSVIKPWRAELDGILAGEKGLTPIFPPRIR